jgi:nitronate monooxygenase
LGRNACATGDITHGILSAEHAFGFAYKARPMTEIIARVEASQHLALYRQGGAV